MHYNLLTESLTYKLLNVFPHLRQQPTSFSGFALGMQQNNKMEFTGKVLPVVRRPSSSSSGSQALPLVVALPSFSEEKCILCWIIGFQWKLRSQDLPTGRDLSLTNKLPARMGEPPKIMTLTQLQVRNNPDLIDR